MAESLFSDFSPVSTEEWWDRIRKDLKGKDPDRLTYTSLDGIQIKPVYRTEHLPASAADPGLRNPDYGSVHLHLEGTNPASFAGVLSEEVLEGVNSLGLTVGEATPGSTGLSPDQLQHWLQSGKIDFHLQVSPDVASDWCEWLMTAVPQWGTPLRGSLNTGIMEGFMPHYAAAAQWIEDTRNAPGWRVLGLDLQAVYETTGSDVEELAQALAQATEVLDALTQRGFTPEEVFANFQFTLSCGTDFMTGIAKFRAFRRILTQFAAAYQVSLTPEQLPPVLAITSRRVYSWMDPHTNLLRGTTAALSAVLGGAQYVSVRPWDEYTGAPQEAPSRIAKNVLLLLKNESYLDQVEDPAGGAWYLESLTDELANRAWKRFQEIEGAGGYLARRAQFDPQPYRDAEDQKLAHKKQVRVGVNEFPNAKDTIPGSLSELYSFDRPARVYEALRKRGLAAAETTSIFLFTFGHPAMRTARASFSQNLLGVTGIPVEENPWPGDIDKVLAHLKKEPKTVVVFCSDNDSWPEAPIEAVRELLPHSLLILAGIPEDLSVYQSRGMDHCIFAGMNAPGFLNQLLDEITLPTS